jgi:cytochrome c oxidase subunit 4
MNAMMRYSLTAAGLFALLALTVGAAYVPMGPMNTPVALTIAAAKGVLILGIFMHGRGASPVLKVFITLGFFWLALMAGLTMADYLTRGG